MDTTPTKTVRQARMEKVITILFYGALLAVFGCYIWSDIEEIIYPTDDTEYCHGLTYLLINIGYVYFISIYFILTHLIYINKQYTVWCARLFYILGISCLVYVFFAAIIHDNLFEMASDQNMRDIVRCSRNLLTAMAYPMIISYFLVPKFIKDNMKLKEEQDLTI